MFIAVSNSHGWGKAATEKEALDQARRNSAVKDGRLRVKVWDCTAEAFVDSFGCPVGITSAPAGREYAPVGSTRTWQPVPYRWQSKGKLKA